MSRQCSVCAHPERRRVDAQIVEGVSNRAISRQFGVSKDAVARHAESHLPESLTRAKAAAQVADADDLLGRLRTFEARAVALLDRAEREGDLRTALAGIREARSCLELMAELTALLDRRPVVVLAQSAEWLAVQRAITDALRPYPTAALAVAEAVASVGGEP